ncbi:TPA: hypothetical protein ACRX87_003390 [Klebsiella pneumoniae]
MTAAAVIMVLAGAYYLGGQAARRSMEITAEREDRKRLRHTLDVKDDVINAVQSSDDTLTLSLPLIGCVIKPPAHRVLFCDAANPIYVSHSDQLKQETKREILSHNVQGATLCHWSNPRNN